MNNLFPPIQPNQDYFLEVDDLHTIYVEESGNALGIPVVYLHGGPGVGSEAFQRQLFDPQHYRIVLFDQRGCGRSKPHAELQRNTTPHLIADMEQIRRHLKIDRWLVAGGSWGSTLSLAYAQQHPERVLGLIVRGIFLATQKELDWLYSDGASGVFPDHWEKFKDAIPLAEQGNLLEAYHQRLIGTDELLRMKAAKNWSMWEARIATLLPDKHILENFADPHNAISIARIETDYFVHQCYLEEGQLLTNMDRITDIPGMIVHGRYDMICPLEQAWNLHKSWPMSELCIVPGAGHVASEPGISRALISASNKMIGKLK